MDKTVLQSASAPADPTAGDAAARRAIPRGAMALNTFVLMLCLFLAALDQTIVAPALPTIGRSLGDFENLSWTVSAFFLTATAVAPVFGRLSDIFGRRVLMFWALGLFMLGSLVCAIAPTMLILILGRALQGLGGGGLFPLVQTIVSDLVPARQRGRYQNYFSITWIVAGIGGPVLGGILADLFHWSMIFWINLPLGLFAVAMIMWKLTGLPSNHKPRRVDLLGGVLLMAAAVLFVLALTWGGVRYPWASRTILSLVGIAAILTVAFVLHARRTTDAFLPLPLLSGSVVAQAALGTACGASTMIGLAVILPMHYQLVHHLTPGMSGVALMPMVGLSVPGAMVSGMAMMRMRHYKYPAIVALIVAALAAFMLFLFPQMPLWACLVCVAAIGFGQGTQFPLATVAVQNAVPPHEVGTATGAVAFVRGLGGAIAVAGFSSIMLTQLDAKVSGGETAELIEKFLAAGPDVAAHALAYVFLTASLALLASAAAYAWMEGRPLAGRRMRAQRRSRRTSGIYSLTADRSAYRV